MIALTVNGLRVAAEHGATVLDPGKQDMSEVFVDFSAVANADDENNEDIVMDLIDDPIIAYSDSIQICHSNHFYAACRRGVFCQGVNVFSKAVLNRARKPAQLAFRASGQIDSVTHLFISESEFALHCFPGYCALLLDLLQRFFRFFAIDLVFQFFYVLFEQAQVAHGNKRGDRLAAALEEHRLTVLDTADGIGQVIVHRLKDLLRHDISPQVEADNGIIARRARRWQTGMSACSLRA